MKFSYWIHPNPPPGSSFTTAQAVEAIRAAVEAWTAANPKLQPDYRGTTADPPGNYNNVVGFGAGCAPGVTACAFMKAGDQAFFAPHTTAFHVILTSTASWSWRPCRPAVGEPCSPYEGNGMDVQSVTAHEFGHVFGLGEVTSSDDFEMTMYPRGGNPPGTVLRDQNTLALGDVLGVRKLYPCDCPMPAIYRP